MLSCLCQIINISVERRQTQIVSLDLNVAVLVPSKKISNDQELIQSDPISCPQNQKGNN